MSGSFTMRGGVIRENTATTNGGGVYHSVAYPFKLSGNPVIKGNTAILEGSEVDNNVLINSYESFITVTGELTDGADIGVTVAGQSRVFTNTDADKLTFNDASKFSSDEEQRVVGQTAEGQLLCGTPKTVNIEAPANGTLTVKNGRAAIADGDKVVLGALITVTANPAAGCALEALCYKSGTGEDAVPIANGESFELSTDVTITASFTDKVVAVITNGGARPKYYSTFGNAVNDWKRAGTGSTLTLLANVTTEGLGSDRSVLSDESEPTEVNESAFGEGLTEKILDLNGYGILETRNRDAGYAVICVDDHTYLQLKDSRPDTTHYISLDGSGRATGVSDSASDGAVQIHGGYISGGIRGKVFGGGMIICDGSAVNMTGGTIIGNTAVSGGGVCNLGSFAMSGGAIVKNAATTDGGGVFLGGAVLFSVSGNPLITGNTAIRGNGPTDNNVALMSENAMITVTGELTAGADIGVTVEGDHRAFTDTSQDDRIYNNVSKFSSDDERYYVSRNADGQLFLDTLYAVSFDLQGHGTAIAGVTVSEGAALVRPDDPADADYDFGGWYTDAGCTAEYDFGKAVTANFTLYAKWTEKKKDEKKEGEKEESGESEGAILNAISITTPPVKTAYKAGEKFDPAGMVVTAYYSDKSSHPVTGYEYSPAAELSPGNDTVTISYTEGGISCTASLTISVREDRGDISNGHSMLDPVPLITEETKLLYMVQGQTFTMPKKGWSLADAADKDIISVSKKGVVKAKKAGEVTLNLTENGEVRQCVNVKIFKPVIEKALSLKTGEDKNVKIKRSGYDEEHLKALWVSSAPDVVTVDQSGLVMPVSKGKAVVTAHINGKAYKCSVTVKEPEPARERTLHMIKGGTKSLSNKKLKNAVWRSESDLIAQVNGTKVKALAAGETVLTTTVNGVEYKIMLIVEDVELSGDGLKKAKGKNKYKLTLREGESTKLTFVSVKQPVVFKCSKAESAFIDENGVVSARKSGDSKFTAKIDGKTVTITVSVKKAKIN